MRTQALHKLLTDNILNIDIKRKKFVPLKMRKLHKIKKLSGEQDIFT